MKAMRIGLAAIVAAWALSGTLASPAYAQATPSAEEMDEREAILKRLFAGVMTDETFAVGARELGAWMAYPSFTPRDHIEPAYGLSIENIPAFAGDRDWVTRRMIERGSSDVDFVEYVDTASLRSLDAFIATPDGAAFMAALRESIAADDGAAMDDFLSGLGPTEREAVEAIAPTFDRAFSLFNWTDIFTETAPARAAAERAAAAIR